MDAFRIFCVAEYTYVTYYKISRDSYTVGLRTPVEAVIPLIKGEISVLRIHMSLPAKEFQKHVIRERIAYLH